MTEQEQRAILTICLMSAFADGAKDERERDQIRRVAESLSHDSDIDLTAIYQEVLLKRASVDDAAAALATPELRQLAYEMAVCVCDADDVRNDSETEFLDLLRGALGLDRSAIEPFQGRADALAAEPVDEVQEGSRASGGDDDGDLDRMILNASILNGALELLPQTLATMAIIPLQMRMVYRIGRAYGFELDRGHLKDFLATVGVGLTSQYVERFGRRLIGGIFGGLAGALGRGLGSAATGSAFSFATTYALGQVAKSYYSGGRTLDTQRLRETFDAVLGEAKTLQRSYLPQIEQRASAIDPGELLSLVRSPGL